MNRAKFAARAIFAVSVLTVTASAGALVYASAHKVQHTPATSPARVQAEASPEAVHLSTRHPYVGVFERGVPATFRPIQGFGKVAGIRPSLTVYYSGWQDPFQARFVRHVTATPVLISEVGIGQVSGQAKNIPGLFGGIKRDHMLGLLWFDVAQHAGLYHQNWRLEGHPAASRAFRAGVRSLQAG
jgi:hypothetical protein